MDILEEILWPATEKRTAMASVDPRKTLQILIRGGVLRAESPVVRKALATERALPLGTSGAVFGPA